MKHPNPHADGVDVTRLVGRSRRQVDKSAQRCMAAMVDYLAASGTTAQPLNGIGDLARLVLKRTEAIAAARKFIAECENADDCKVTPRG